MLFFFNSSDNKSLNFEQLAEIIDKLSSLGFDSYPCNNLFNRLISSLHISYPHIAQSHYIPFFYREIIANAIIDSEDNQKADNYDVLQEQQQGFLEYISNRCEKVSVVSLNYDDSIPKSIDNLTEFKYCFDYNQGAYDKMLDIAKFFMKRK